MKIDRSALKDSLTKLKEQFFMIFIKIPFSLWFIFFVFSILYFIQLIFKMMDFFALGNELHEISKWFTVSSQQK